MSEHVRGTADEAPMDDIHSGDSYFVVEGGPLDGMGGITANYVQEQAVEGVITFDHPSSPGDDRPVIYSKYRVSDDYPDHLVYVGEAEKSEES